MIKLGHRQVVVLGRHSPRSGIMTARLGRASMVVLILAHAFEPGFPIWSWYPPQENSRRALMFLGSDARNPAR